MNANISFSLKKLLTIVKCSI